ncbi:MAG: DUF177 domain-containing protein [Gallionella sp.]
MYARPFIDSLDFANNGREISGTVPVAELPRLQEMLEHPHEILSYTVRGGVDKQGYHFLDVSVTGSFQLRCQRCLEGMDYPAQLDTRLLLRDQTILDALDSKEHLAGHPDEEDEFDSILADSQLDVLNLLEDEILLSLPIAPKHEPGAPSHEQGACQAAGGGDRPLRQAQDKHEEDRQPFAVLAKLKRN